MERAWTRREFVGGTFRLAAGAGAAALLAGKLRAGEEGSRLVLAVRDSHLKETGEKDCWAAMKAIGAEGVEAAVADDLTLPDLFGSARYSIADDAAIARLAADLKAAGRKVTAFCLHNRFDERPEVEIDLCARTARAAKALGTPAVRIDVWPHKLEREEFLPFSIETLKKVLARTEDTGVAFGIENHGHVTNDPEFLKPLFAGVGSKRLGLTLDTGNFYWYGHPLARLYELYEEFAPRAVHTHCKSIRYPEGERGKKRPVGWEYGKYTRPIDEGDIDFTRVVKILRGAGYSNDLCVEDESLGQFPAGERGKVLAREIAFLKSLL